MHNNIELLNKTICVIDTIMMLSQNRIFYLFARVISSNLGRRDKRFETSRNNITLLSYLFLIRVLHTAENGPCESSYWRSTFRRNTFAGIVTTTCQLAQRHVDRFICISLHFIKKIKKIKFLLQVHLTRR